MKGGMRRRTNLLDLPDLVHEVVSHLGEAGESKGGSDDDDKEGVAEYSMICAKVDECLWNVGSGGTIDISQGVNARKRVCGAN